MSTKINAIIGGNANLQERLLKLGQKTLNKGEIFILAKVIADAIPLPKEACDNIRLYNLNHRGFIDNVLYAFEGFVYIPTDEYETIYRLIDEMVSWRYGVATGKAICLFTGEAQNVVDDMTGFLRYVNMSDVCGVADIAGSANYIYTMFKDVVSFVK